MKKKPTTVYVPATLDAVGKSTYTHTVVKIFGKEEYISEQRLITFTPEEFNQFLESFGQELLNRAAKNSRMTGIAYGNDTSIADYEVDKNSITEVLPKVLKKWKIQ